MARPDAWQTSFWYRGLSERLPLTPECHKGYDAGKKVSGIKRHISKDCPMTYTSTAGHRPGRGFERWRRDGLSQVQNVLVDGGYTGKPFATAVQGCWEIGGSGETPRTAHLRGASKAHGWWSGLSPGWKSAATLEDSKGNPVHGGACLHGANPDVNRLLTVQFSSATVVLFRINGRLSGA